MVPAELTLPVSLAAVAAASYLVFWGFFANARIGSVAAWTALAAAAVFGARASARAALEPLWRSPDWRRPALLMVSAGLLYLGVTTLFEDARQLTQLSANRFLALPVDNAIPQMFAERLAAGQSPRQLVGEWLSSDRPPLQAGWVLLLSTLLRPLWWPDFDVAAQSAGIWFQLMWVPAAWAWLRSIGASTRAATAVLAALVPCGVLLINSVFVWPKLGAGALLVTAALLLVLRSSPQTRSHAVLGASLAALAWLAHTGVAFALIALAPLVLLRLRSTGLRPWLLCALVFAAWSAPWTAYQRFYEPPANHLLKWHLAGVPAVDDPRGTLRTLVDSYRQLTPEQWLDRRRSNLLTFARGPWLELLRFDFRSVVDRRLAEFFFVLFSFGFWNLGWLALTRTLVRSRQEHAPQDRTLALGLAWAALTAIVTAVLLFEPGAAVIHQGSYNLLLLPLTACAFALWRLHPLLWLSLAAAQWLLFVRVWLPLVGSAAAPFEPLPAILAALAAAGLAALALSGARRPPVADRQSARN
jgi:hypothetical protein